MNKIVKLQAPPSLFDQINYTGHYFVNFVIKYNMHTFNKFTCNFAFSFSFYFQNFAIYIKIK